MYNRLPEDEPSGSKHVEDIVKLKYWFNKGSMCWFILYEVLAISVHLFWLLETSHMQTTLKPGK